MVAKLQVDSNYLSLAQLGMSVVCGLASEVYLVGWEACKRGMLKVINGGGLKDMVVLGGVRILTVLLGLTALKYIAVSFTRTRLFLVGFLQLRANLENCFCRDHQVVGAVLHGRADVLAAGPAHGLAGELVARAHCHGARVLQLVGRVVPHHRLCRRAHVQLRRLHPERAHQAPAQPLLHVRCILKPSLLCDCHDKL